MVSHRALWSKDWTEVVPMKSHLLLSLLLVAIMPGLAFAQNADAEAQELIKQIAYKCTWFANQPPLTFPRPEQQRRKAHPEMVSFSLKHWRQQNSTAKNLTGAACQLLLTERAEPVTRLVFS